MLQREGELADERQALAKRRAALEEQKFEARMMRMGYEKGMTTAQDRFVNEALQDIGTIQQRMAGGEITLEEGSKLIDDIQKELSRTEMSWVKKKSPWPKGKGVGDMWKEGPVWVTRGYRGDIKKLADVESDTMEEVFENALQRRSQETDMNGNPLPYSIQLQRAMADVSAHEASKSIKEKFKSIQGMPLAHPFGQHPPRRQQQGVSTGVGPSGSATMPATQRTRISPTRTALNLPGAILGGVSKGTITPQLAKTVFGEMVAQAVSKITGTGRPKVRTTGVPKEQQPQISWPKEMTPDEATNVLNTLKRSGRTIQDLRRSSDPFDKELLRRIEQAVAVIMEYRKANP